MKILSSVIIALLYLAAPARATGGFSCEVDDENLQFVTESALGRVRSSPILNLKAHATIKLKDTPIDLSELDLRTHLAHSWIDHPEFKLQFYLEREGETPHGTFELILVTKATDDDGTYDGDYRLSIFFTEPPADQTTGRNLNATGKVKCFIE